MAGEASPRPIAPHYLHSLAVSFFSHAFWKRLPRSLDRPRALQEKQQLNWPQFQALGIPPLLFLSLRIFIRASLTSLEQARAKQQTNIIITLVSWLRPYASTGAVRYDGDDDDELVDLCLRNSL